MKITKEQEKAIGYYYEELVRQDHNFEAVNSRFPTWRTDYEKAIAELLTFSTRDEYLAWAAEWKAEYAQLSKDIRQLKRSRKMSSPTYSPSARWMAWQMGRTATLMLWVRKVSKEFANRLRESRLEREKAAKV